ncbi:MAG: type I 3-dehydroquinate dehydratase [Salinirussus sp.]
MHFDSFVLAAATTDLDDEPAAREHADAMEFRLDGASAPLAALDSYTGALPLIATNRPEREGGGVPDGPGRLDTLREAAEMPGVAAIDVELSSVEAGDADAVIDAARTADTRVIVSTHDFKATPTRERLRELLSRAGEHGDVAKLAVTAQSPADVLDVLEVTWAATRDDETVATMAMGEAGRHSRAVAPLYGSRIGYAPVDPARATAPGQYDLSTLRQLVNQLSGPED